MPSKLLSKTKYLNGLQCPKLLWILFHEPEKIPEPNAATQYIFDQEHMVGELAKKLFPDGVNVPDQDFIDNIRQTRELPKQRKILFEGGISVGNIYASMPGRIFYILSTRINGISSKSRAPLESRT